MECIYCKQNLKSSPATGFSSKLNIYFCSKCRAEYTIFKGSLNIFGTHLYTDVNEKVYRWSTYGNEPTIAHLYFIGRPGIPGVQLNSEVVKINSFKEYPDITPQNIQSKIKTILTFL